MKTRAIRYKVRTRLGRYTWTYFPLMTLLGDRNERLVGRDTEIVIEGFPRSANTFAKFAFEDAQRRDVKIAHHTHSPAQVIRGVRYAVPCLVLIREPEQSIRSFLVHSPHVEPPSAIKSYELFYSTLLPVRDKVVVADFHRVTSQFDSVIQEINNKYGTSFLCYEPSQENIERTLARMRQFGKAHNRSASKISAPGGDKVLQEIKINLDAYAAQLKLLYKLYQLFITEN